METNELIKKRRLELGLTLKDVADALGVAESTVLRYERKDIQNMGIDKIVELAKVLKCTPTYLLGWDGNQVRPTDNSLDISAEEEEETVKIRLFGSLPAGIPLNEITDVIGYEDIPAYWVENGQKYIAVKIKDISMYPKYIVGDVITVLVTPNCHSGADILAYVDGSPEAILRQLQKHDDGSLTLKSYNPEYPPKTYRPEDDGVTILGLVRQMCRIIWKKNNNGD
jgi:repressor LexA